LGDSGAIKSYLDSRRWIITLPGQPSFPFKRICEVPDPFSNHFLCHQKKRWFEVYVGSLKDKKTPGIDVITRMQDEFTNNIAEGYAKLVARYYEGRYDDGNQ